MGKPRNLFAKITMSPSVLSSMLILSEKTTGRRSVKTANVCPSLLTSFASAGTVPHGVAHYVWELPNGIGLGLHLSGPTSTLDQPPLASVPSSYRRFACINPISSTSFLLACSPQADRFPSSLPTSIVLSVPMTSRADNAEPNSQIQEIDGNSRVAGSGEKHSRRARGGLKVPQQVR